MNTRREDRQAALDAGFDDFLTKPAMPKQILRAVERALTATRAGLTRALTRALTPLDKSSP